ncbi:MAG: hypothetical protein WCZ90_17070 [Melioribacteraceae bacterium]
MSWQTNMVILKSMIPKLVLVFFSILLVSWKTLDGNWISEKRSGYNLIYTSVDLNNKDEYIKLVENGIISVETFFGARYKEQFNIFIHPNRHSLDSTWQKAWNAKDFKSECWMVASGVASRLDMISPKGWNKEACEHHYDDTISTQRLITHELVHVYHGQLNPSPDFSNVEGIDWFVEGLANYTSGQCDSLRISTIKDAISNNKIPSGLESFWTGNLRYALSGSVVMYIDIKFGRIRLKQLLSLTKKSDILSSLNTSEAKLLTEWKKYIKSL